MYYKIPQNENVGGLNDNWLQFFYHLVVLFQYAECIQVLLCFKTTKPEMFACNERLNAK